MLTIKHYIYFFFLIFFVACNSKPDVKNKNNAGEVSQEIDTSTILIKYNNNLFTLPSPYQATYSIKSTNLPFEKNLLNPVKNVSNYITNFEQALNVGVYGTDLGYLNLYDQIPDVISYFSAIKKLSKELGIDGALEIEVIKKVENNIDNQDSLLNLITETYRDFDYYLKQNNRKDIGVLILTGGWIESVYILSQSAMKDNDRNIINRLGEQKHPLDNLIEILSPYYYNSKEFTELIDALVDLAYEFDGIIFNYTYIDTKVDVENKTTRINSKSNVILSEYHLKTISNKIASIRNKIIN